MTTWTALSIAPDRTTAETLAARLEDLDPTPTGVGAFEIEDGSGLWEVGGYFLERPDGVALDILAAASGAAAFTVSKIPETDWVAKVRRELSPVRAGRFVVYGRHDEHRISRHLIRLRIEAAMAFGTGHHETTLGCLLALDHLAKASLPPRCVADIGCGTGVLAMAAAKRWRKPVIASDIDQQAVRVAGENMRANGIGGMARVLCAAGFRHEAIRQSGPYDLIMANILARPLRRLAPDMAAQTAPGGHIVLSGILNRQAKGVETRYRAWGFSPIKRLRLGEWTTLVLHK